MHEPSPAMTPDEATRPAPEEVLGYRFKNPALLEHSLRHASVCSDRLASNERLEFLGDAVLGMVACDLIFQRFPESLEGDMTKLKSAVVSRRTCSRIARRLGLDDMLELGKGMRGHGRLPGSLSACVLEAVIAAVYLDGGIDAARGFLEPLLEPEIKKAADCGHQQNFKSVLQQHAQAEGLGMPSYSVLDEQGPDHAKAFKVMVEVGRRRFEACWGNSKKLAEQKAALCALSELGVVESAGADGEVRVVQRADATADAV